MFDIFKKRETAKFSFKKIFPKTFAYLEFFLYSLKPKQFKNGIPDVSAEIDFQKPKGSVIAQGGDGRIMLYLHNILENFTDFNIEKYDFRKKGVLLKFCKLIDSQPRFQHILIHEYMHCIQYKLNPDYFFNLNFNNPDVFEKFSKEVLKKISSKYSEKQIWEDWGKQPDELQASLTQWIFLKLKNWDSYSISAFDCMLGKTLDALKRDYISVKAGIKESEKNKVLNWKKLKELYHQRDMIKEKIRRAEYLNKRAEKLVKHLRRKYVNFLKTQKK